MDQSDQSKASGFSQAIYVLRPLGEAEESRVTTAGAFKFGVGYYVQVLWRNRLVLLAGGLIAALAAYGASLAMPEVYEAKASLIISPPAFGSELDLPVFPIDVYRNLIQSDALVSRTKLAFRQAHGFAENQHLGLGFSTIVHPSRDRNAPFLPMVDLVVEAAGPKAAELAANLWAQSAVAEIGSLSKRSSSAVADFIENEYTAAEDRLGQSENDLESLEKQFDKRRLRLQGDWESKIGQFNAEWDLPTSRAEAESLRTLLTLPAAPSATEPDARVGGLLVQLQEVTLRTNRVKNLLERLDVEIDSHPPSLMLSKAITNNALWESVMREGSDKAAQDRIGEFGLRTEEQNPVYTDLAQRRANARVEYESLLPQQAQLESRISAVREQMKALNQLIAEKSAELQRLIWQRDSELELLQRERELAKTQQTRRVDALKSTFQTLASRYESARLVRAEEDSDIKIAASAVGNPIPVRPRVLINTLIGLLVGVLLSASVVFLREAFRGSAQQPDPAAVPIGDVVPKERAS